MSTEPAWVNVLGRTDLSKDEAYEYTAGPIETIIADAEKKMRFFTFFWHNIEHCQVCEDK